MPKLPAWLLPLFIIVALCGFGDASYLTAEHLRGVVPPCSVVSGCQTVLTSAYATIGGVPVSALGMVYYGTLLVALIAYVDTRNQRLLRAAAWLTVAGLGASVYFVSIQAFVLSAYCLYCLTSAAISTVLFALGMTTIVKLRQS